MLFGIILEPIEVYKIGIVAPLYLGALSFKVPSLATLVAIPDWRWGLDGVEIHAVIWVSLGLVSIGIVSVPVVLLSISSIA
jgi:hypothetical protein